MYLHSKIEKLGLLKIAFCVKLSLILKTGLEQFFKCLRNLQSNLGLKEFLWDLINKKLYPAIQHGYNYNYLIKRWI